MKFGDKLERSKEVRRKCVSYITRLRFYTSTLDGSLMTLLTSMFIYTTPSVVEPIYISLPER